MFWSCSELVGELCLASKGTLLSVFSPRKFDRRPRKMTFLIETSHSLQRGSVCPISCTKRRLLDFFKNIVELYRSRLGIGEMATHGTSSCSIFFFFLFTQLKVHPKREQNYFHRNYGFCKL